MNPQDDILDALIQDGQYQDEDSVDYGDYLPMPEPEDERQ
jgi:hypothetical protein